MHTRADILDALKGIDLFADLSKKELTVLADCLREQEFADGADIVSEGDTDGRFFIVSSGTAIARVSGKKLTTISKGQWFGEIALIDRGPRTATVTAQGPVTTLSIASFTFRPILKTHPEMQHKLLLKLCERLRAADKRLHLG